MLQCSWGNKRTQKHNSHPGKTSESSANLTSFNPETTCNVVVVVVALQEKEEAEAAAHALSNRDAEMKARPEAETTDDADAAGPSPPKIPKVEFLDDAFHMITQLPWEDEVRRVKNKNNLLT